MRMYVYLSSEYDGTKESYNRISEIAKKIQSENHEHCVISPAHAFCFLADPCGENTATLREDIISLMCEEDILLVCSEVGDGVRREIALANLIGMRVEFIGENNTVRL